MSQDNKNLFIGLDVGSDSVGWAVTDEDFNLYRLKGKTAWGARLFSEASDAKDRRTHRTSRRRLARRKERVRLLNTLFDPLVASLDPTFFCRLENSTLQEQDKPSDAKADGFLFASREKEKEFYKAYPTIWHLRKALIANDDAAFSDIRYLYLAIHHIVKYRGNFINQSGMKIGEFDFSCFDGVNEFFKTFFSTELDDEDPNEPVNDAIPHDNYQEFLNKALDKNLPKNAKKSALLKLMSYTDAQKPFAEMLCTLASGGSFSTKKLNSKDEEKYEAKDIVFNSKYDENEDSYKSILGDAFDLVDYAKTIFDFYTLKDILGDNGDLSSAFVSIYEAHKAELKALKDICKDIDVRNDFKDKDRIYYKLFKDETNPANYAAFTRNGSSADRCDIADFDKYVVSLLTPFEDGMPPKHRQLWEQLKTLAGQNRLLQTIALRSTSVIPMQLHRKELLDIVDNAVKRKVPGFNQELKDKLVALFEYKIPYYCGPLTKQSKYSNVEFRDEIKTKVLPWNYKDIIDFDATKQKFMKGLTNRCTYLKDCEVLPKQSLLFQEYDAWNKINSLTIKGGKLSKDELRDIYVFASSRPKTTLKNIGTHLKKRGKTQDDIDSLSGINTNDFIDLSSLAALSDAFSLKDEDGLLNRFGKDFEVCERALYLKAIFTDSPLDAEVSINKEFPVLSDKQRKALKSVSCKGWASLSKEFLTLRSVNKDGTVNDEGRLIDLLASGEGSLNQLLFDERFGFRAAIDAHNSNVFKEKTKKEVVNDLIEEMPPKMRRPVIQAVRIVEEIVKVAKKEPDTIAIEVTRENNDSKKKQEYSKEAVSRKEQIEKFLKNLIGDEKARAAEVGDELKNLVDVDKLRGKHLYLYFLQNGRDAYSGEPIDINDVLNGTKYDTDHIIPQSLMKDDSLDNLVLVNKEANQHKSNEYPLPISIRNENNVKLWKRLRKAGMMSDKKYNNLTRATPLTEEELSSFVAAQINVVNRSNVVIRDILHEIYPNARLIFSKAQYPSMLRRDLEIPKLRDLNDTHHAVDAFLNIVAGVKLTDRFGDMRTIKAMEKARKAIETGDNAQIDKYSLNMERYLKHQVLSSDGAVSEFGKHIKDTSNRHDFLLTYRFEYQDSAFYKATINPASKTDSLICVHDDMPTDRYGGYSELKSECNCVATIKGKKKTTRYLVGVPHIYLEHKKNDPTYDIEGALVALVPHKEGDEVTVDWKHPVPLKATLRKNRFDCLLTSSNAKQVNIFPFSAIFLSPWAASYICSMLKFVEKHQKEAAEKQTITILKGKGREEVCVFGAQQSKKVLLELFLLSEQARFDGMPMITNLRTDETRAKLVENIIKANVLEQYKLLRKVFSLFTRKSRLYAEQVTLKGRGVILLEGFKIVSKSITGLYETERPL